MGWSLLFAFAALVVCLHPIAAIDGSWGEWTEWISCSVSCGSGERKRFRACDPAPRLGGQWCQGKYLETEPCVTDVECPVNGGWGAWSPWSPCSASCGEGTKQRYRPCNSPIPMHGGSPCSGEPRETENCFALRACPRDGGWTSWSTWSSCSVTCGEGGTRLRYRVCSNPPPAAEGRPCEGSGRIKRACSAPNKCPVNGQWAEWTSWSECSVSCGKGERMRRRTCDRPPPQFGGSDCDRSEAGELQVHSCTATPRHCPVDGSWSEWGEWGVCHSPNCFVNTIPSLSMRQRSCNSPLPAHNGEMCQGSFLDSGLCSPPLNCKVEGGWSEWSAWNCTKYVASRQRACDNPPPANGGSRCKGNPVQFHDRDEDPETYRDACPNFPTDDEDISEASGQQPDYAGSGDGATDD